MTNMYVIIMILKMQLVQTLEMTQMFYKTRTKMHFSSFVVEFIALKAELIKKRGLMKNAYGLSF